MMNFSMNSAMNAMNAAGASAGKVAANGAPLDAAQAPDGAQPGMPADAAAPQPAAQVLPFQQWISLGAVPSETDEALPVDGAAPEATPHELAADQPDDTAAQDAVAIDAALAALSVITPQAALAAMPAMMMAMPGAKPGAANDGAAPATTPVAVPAMDVALDVEALPQAAARGASDTLPLPVTPAAPRADVAVAQALPAAATAAATSTSPTAPAAAAPAAGATLDAAPADGAEPAPTTATTTTGVAGAASQPAAARGADSVVLAGPPTAWRQTLQEALGDRLQLQLGRGAEQATIRLEPPMLGRIDISVRHSGGNLEVSIAASNSEVLRQLNTVSDSLRNDLAGRQYSNVSVSVSEPPRAQSTAQAGNQPSGQPGADAGGRGRQQEQQEQRQRTPGLALNDAGDAGSLFSMNNRD
ncbi:flagellar hook-length control protein FliK [Massilia timonae]|uniref:flagellar hook-length control protein FliK n=1 Tax=Massilia timonae TaxID=47229 RepID=UPI0028992163|nr:flagellar hook-length control protein FliK [Massilia timonae]